MTVGLSNLGDTDRWKDEFIAGHPDRALDLLSEAITFCEARGLTDSQTYLWAHIDLCRLHRALGNVEQAAEHFCKAVELGADANWLELN